MAATLEPHPTSPPQPKIALEADAERGEDGDLRLRFRLRAALDGLVLPVSVAPRFRLGLWEHTCFEVFVAVEGSEAYHEFNLSPSGEWAILSFRAYRERDGEVRGATLGPPIRTSARSGLFELAATLPLRRLELANAPLRVGLAAVLEATSGARSYWALRHPSPSADFHHPDSRVLPLPAGRVDAPRRT